MCDVRWHSVIDMLKFFAKEGIFSYVDRIGNALTPDLIEVAIKDALRHLASLYYSSIKEVVKKDDKEITLHYFIDKNNEKKLLPKIPSQEEVSLFLKAVREDISCARITAILSMSF